ncbi:MAG: glycosyl transferase family 2, partial [Flavobacteriaceae bacterium]|nr:glycosyl transferase family 2 [Flavobacteriaceae bacterium]
LIFFICYWFTFKNIYGGGFARFLEYVGMFFVFFSIAMGFSVHNSVAVLEGHIGKKSEFIRTPKFNISSLKDSWKGNKYLKNKVSANVIIEGLLMLYFGFGMYSAFVVGDQGGDFGLFPFHLMLFIGFGFVFFKSITSKV